MDYIKRCVDLSKHEGGLWGENDKYAPLDFIQRSETIIFGKSSLYPDEHHVGYSGSGVGRPSRRVCNPCTSLVSSRLLNLCKVMMVVPEILCRI